MLSQEQKESIRNHVATGRGYREIADVEYLSRNSVKEYIDELLAMKWCPKDDSDLEFIDTQQCGWCGKIGNHNKTGRPKRFCCDNCRRAYNKLYHSSIKQRCVYCGKNFEAQNNKQRFCSHDCYIKNRFWTEEDATKIVRALIAGEDVIIPEWLKMKLQKQMRK